MVEGLIARVSGLECRVIKKMITAGCTARVMTRSDSGHCVLTMGELCAFGVSIRWAGLKSEFTTNKLFICGSQLCLDK